MESTFIIARKPKFCETGEQENPPHSTEPSPTNTADPKLESSPVDKPEPEVVLI